MDMNIDLNILEVEPAEEYHARAGEYLSSHQLADFIKCPLLYRRKVLGLIDDKESPAYLLGRATHVRILEGRDVYETQFALGGPINSRTEIARGNLSAICRAVGVMQPRDSVELHNIPLQITVKCRKREDNGEITNELKGYEAKASAAGHPQQAPANDTTPPWKR